MVTAPVVPAVRVSAVTVSLKVAGFVNVLVLLPVEDPDYLTRAIALIKDRATFVADLWELGSFLFLPPVTYSETAIKKHWKEDTPELLTSLGLKLQSIADFSPEVLEVQVKDWISSNGLSFGKIMAPLRLVLVGDLKGPHLYDIMALLGKEATVSRISNALEQIK